MRLFGKSSIFDDILHPRSRIPVSLSNVSYAQDYNMSFAGLIAGAIAGGLIEILLSLILPERKARRHILAIVFAIIVFATISVTSNPKSESGSSNNDVNSIEAEDIFNSTIIQSVDGDITINQPLPTSTVSPTQTPDVANLYTYFPPPTMNSVRTYDFSVAYSDFADNENVEKRVAGSFSEIVRVVNDKYQSDGVTIIGVERIGGGDFVVSCPEDFYWYVYDATRFYLICSKNYVDAAASLIVQDSAPYQIIHSQFGPEPLSISPHYLAPLEIDKRWVSGGYRIAVEDKVTKKTPLGTFRDCFRLLFFQIHYQEFRYICPSVGVVAIEVTSRGDLYSAALTELK